MKSTLSQDGNVVKVDVDCHTTLTGADVYGVPLGRIAKTVCPEYALYTNGEYRVTLVMTVELVNAVPTPQDK